ncbi:HWE histidine kinase domain-containing protein [Aurantimonas sp. A2-1-M11]|uniref:HWE histidine kinase domain-containing protein n=1 Tax=Aurantimonas sp. A2-1-M11 TaxID=3113712 RepID=UPI002F9327BC
MAVWDYDTSTDTLSGTDELNQLLGFPAGYPFDIDQVRSRYYPGDGDKMREEAAASLARGERFIQSEYRYFWPDGSVRWHLMRAEVFMEPDGTPTKVVGILIDITDRKRAEEALAERERELRAALDAASLGTYTFDHKTRELKASARLKEIYCYPRDQELTLDDLRARYHPQDCDHISQLFSSAFDPAQHRFDMEFRLLLPGGTVRWVQGRGEYLRNAEGQPVLSRGIVSDVSDRKRWEEHQKLLVDELNHRVKNTLATVQSLASQSFRPGEDPAAAKEAFIDRLTALGQAHDVLTRKNWDSADLTEIVSAAVRPFQRGERERFKVEGQPLRLSPR